VGIEIIAQRIVRLVLVGCNNGHHNLKIREKPPRGCSSRDVTLSRPQCAPLWLQGDRPNTPLSDPVRVVVQPCQGSLAVSSRSAPEHFGGSSRAGPNDRVDVIRGGLFGPEELLTPEDEMTLGIADVGVGIERVSLGLL
jgi:hypothetical protein